mgnify:CR=1 FL=1
MSTLRFTEDHEWIEVDGGIGTVGITKHAQDQLGDIVFVELPEVGQQLDTGAEAGTVESVKAASEIYAPVGGEVVAVNEALADEPGQVNADPRGEGWLFKIQLKDPSELDGLMDEAAYTAHAEG